MFYKDVAPLALEGSAGFSPLQRAIDDDVRFLATPRMRGQ